MFIKATIDRLENGKVILKTARGESIVWDKNALPENIHEGTVLNIAINMDNATESSDQELAKNILNEILDTRE